MSTHPGNGGFISGKITPLSYTADNQTTGYEISYAFEERNPSLIFKSANPVVNINITFNTLNQNFSIALINHKIPETASIKLRYYPDSTFSTHSVEKTIPWTGKNTYIIDTNPTSQYVQIHIDASAAGVESTIGIIYPGTAFQFPHNFSWGRKDEFIVEKTIDTTDSGFHYETPGPDDQPPPDWEKINMTFNDVHGTFRDQYKNLIRPGDKIFIPNFTHTKCYYGIVPDRSLQTTKNKPGETYTLSFWEHGTGESQ